MGGRTLLIIMVITATIISFVVMTIPETYHGKHPIKLGWCTCQSGGERGGHCHCPGAQSLKLKDKNAQCQLRYKPIRSWLCFPFGKRIKVTIYFRQVFNNLRIL